MAEGHRYRETIEQRVLRFIKEQRLVSDGQKLLVAVSGGPDSVCLLHTLVKLRDGLNLELHVAHLDHQLRGAESEADAGYVSDLARRLGVPATVERRDVKAYQIRHGASPEEAAREVRYAFLAEVAGSIGADCVAVGHTGNDHIETILLHLIRGTGTRGLQGLLPKSRWQSPGGNLIIIRPLLPLSRRETESFCRDRQLMPRMDVSNQSLSPLRNRVRHQLLPLLKSYNPRVSEALLRTARIVGEDLALLDKGVDRLWNRIARREGNIVILDKKGFLKLPPARQRQLLRKAIEGLLGSLKDIEARHIEGIMAALAKPAGKRLNLPGGLVFVIEYQQYLIGPEPVTLTPFPSVTSVTIGNEFTLKIPGETLFPGWRVTASITPRTPAKPGDEPDLRKVTNPPGLSNHLTARLDLDKVGGKVIVRYRQPGDRFQPLGMSQSKKLGEFMIDARIPRAWRQSVPIVCSDEHILWVVGWHIDDRVKVTGETRQVLSLEFKLATPAG